MTNSFISTRYVADGHGSIKQSTSHPAPGPGQVLIRTLYAGANRGDVLGLGGAYGEPFPEGQPVGQDAVGVVEAAGSPDLEHLIGSTVVAHVAGAWATYLAADVNSIAAVGDLDPQLAVTLPLAGLTALRLARAAERTLGDLSRRRALITGGTGAVGGILVDLLHAEGNEVWLLTRNKYAGSAHAVASLTDCPKVDMAFESVGGDLMDAALKQLTSEGHLWWFGEVTRQPVTLNFFDYLGSPWHLHHFSSWIHDSSDAADLRELITMTQAHVISPPRATTIQADNLAGALAQIGDGSLKDKVIVDMTPLAEPRA